MSSGKTSDIINIFLFAAILAAIFVFSFILKPDQRVIERENRNLAEFPEITPKNILRGRFSADFELYLQDRVAFRSYLIDLSDRITAFRGITVDAAPVIDGGLLILRDRIMEIFTSNEDAGRRYAEALNSYRAALPENVRMYSILAPTQIEFQNKYNGVSDSEKKALEFVNSLLSPGIRPVDAYSALEKHSSDYIFFRTDHHWTSLGAYYAYLEYMSAAELEPVPLSEYYVRKAENFFGYLYNKAGSKSVISEGDTIYYYELKSEIELSNPLYYPGDKPSYGIFIGGDRPVYEIRTSAGTGRTVCVIKDSYANCFVPFLAPCYDTIIVVDPRTYDGSVTELLSGYGDCDLIFLNYIFTTTFTDFIKNIERVK